MYEVYRDKKAWEVTHTGKPYIKELGANLPKYTVGDIEIEEYELVEPD
jgi:quinol monooxygenase YgiN